MSSSGLNAPIQADQACAVGLVQTTIADIPGADFLRDARLDEELPHGSGPEYQANCTYLEEYMLSVDFSRPQSASQVYVHGELWPLKARALDAMMNVIPRPERVARAAGCAKHCTVYYSPSRQRHQMRGKYCNQRLCPFCARRQAEQWATRVKHWMEPFVPHKWRFITLTLRSTDAPLVEQLQHLRKSFRRLRQTLLWSRTQNYGRAFIEVTWNEERQQWHPHLHIVGHGKYIDQRQLSVAWSKSSGGSSIVHVTEIKNTDKAVKYLTKYASKGACCLTVDDPDDRWRELALATSGRRLVIQYGDQKPLPPYSECIAHEGEDDWVEIAPLQLVLRSAKAGDKPSRYIVADLFEGLDILDWIPPPRCGPR